MRRTLIPLVNLALLANRRTRRVGLLLFLPYLTGERTPHFDADARGAFSGISLKQADVWKRFERHVEQPLEIHLGGREDHEDVLAPLLEDRR